MHISHAWKKKIPNILTTFRLGVAPFIIILGLLNQVHIVLILTVIGCLTDLFDGHLARKWKVTSELGAKLDAFSDKVFASSLLLALTRKLPVLIIMFILEMIIAGINLYFYKIKNKPQTLFIGKIKTTVLFATIVLAFFYAFLSKLHFLVLGFAYTSINLQILCIVSYLMYNISKLKKLKLEDDAYHQKVMEDTIELKKL